MVAGWYPPQEESRVNVASTVHHCRIQSTGFAVVGKIWADNLWPGRISPILPTSPIRWGGGYDRSLLLRPAIFYQLLGPRGQTIGVISGFSTGGGYFRSRGLFVFEEYRRQGFAQLLLGQIARDAKDAGESFLWTLPRITAWGAYNRFGFQLESDWFNKDMEFGPNAYASYSLMMQER